MGVEESMDEDRVLQNLESDAPLTEATLLWLEGEVDEWDCEGWSADVGRAILDRLRRDSMGAG